MCLSISLPVSVSVWLSVFVSVSVCLYLSVCLFVYLFAYLIQMIPRAFLSSFCVLHHGLPLGFFRRSAGCRRHHLLLVVLQP